MTFSEKLSTLRKRKGMSQEQLAELLDVSRQSVSKWEAQQTLPETVKIIQLAEIFDVSIDLLLKDDQSIEYKDHPIVIEAEKKLPEISVETEPRSDLPDTAKSGRLSALYAVLKRKIAEAADRVGAVAANAKKMLHVLGCIKSMSKKTKIVSFIIGGLVLLLLICLALFSGSSKKSDIQESETKQVQEDITPEVPEADIPPAPEKDDSLFLLTQMSYNGDGERTLTIEYQYDDLSRQKVLRHTLYYSKDLNLDPTGYIIVYSQYDTEGNPIYGKVLDLNGQPSGSWIEQSFDRNGNLLTVSSYASDNTIQENEYQYNENGDVVYSALSLDGTLRTVEEYSYDYRGQKVSRQTHGKYYKDDGSLQFEQTVEDTHYEYDEDGRLIKEIFKTNSYNHTITTYEYDSHENLVKKCVYDGHMVLQSRHEYTYVDISVFSSSKDNAANQPADGTTNTVPAPQENEAPAENVNKEPEPEKKIGEPTCAGKLVYRPSESGYYCLVLNQSITVSDCGHSYNELWLFGTEDGELNDYVDQDVLVQGVVFENEFMGIIYMPGYASVSLTEPSNEVEAPSAEQEKAIAAEDIKADTQSPMEAPSDEENQQKELDDAGVPEYLRFDYSPHPTVTLSGYMKDSITFVPDEKVAIKGYWEKNSWDILEELYVSANYDLQKGVRYTLKGKLRYYDLYDVEIVN